MLITVFTPTYNRASYLPVLYKSLCDQSFTDFEWLIVDDGSVDNTSEVVENFINEKKISILYYKKENGGKHRAVNYGVQIAKGELFFIVDSDDKLPLDSLSLINAHYQKIKNDNTFGGICGLKAYFNGDILPGITNFGVIEEKLNDFRFKNSKHGNDSLLEIIAKTKVMKEFPFPEFEGEKFCAESAIWIPIGEKYKFRIFDKVIYMCEFLETGLSANSLRSRMSYPRSAMAIYERMIKSKLPTNIKIRSAINYWRFFLCLTHKERPSISIVYYPYFLLGMILHVMDIRRSKNRLKIGKER